MLPTLRKLGRFVSVGAAATLGYAAIGWLLARAAEIPPFQASIAAYGVAAVFAYVAHRRFTFRSERAHVIAGPQFLVVTAIGMVIAGALALAAEAYRLPVEVGLLATCVVVPCLNFLLLDRVVFVRRAVSSERAP